MKLQIIKKGKNRLKLKTKSAVLDNSIRDYFTVPNKNARHSQYASPTSSPITPLGSFKAGIIKEIIDYVKDKFPEVEIDTSAVEDILHPQTIEIDKLHDLANTVDFDIRGYQDEAVQLALKNGRGTFEMATSAGKSYIITKIIYNIWKTTTKKKTLILVPTIQLVTQFYKEIIEYGIDESDVCMFSRKCPDAPQGNIIISNTQWLNRHSGELPKDIEVTVIDECIRKGQLVKTINGDKKIEDIKIGDLILSYNIKHDKEEYKQVLKTFTNLYKSQSYDHFLRIELEDGKILEVTPNHKIYTSNRGYVRADELTENDDILLSY